MNDDRLRAVEQGQVRIETALDSFAREQRAVNAKLLHFVEGNGRPGAEVRIDRLEQASSRGRWWIRIIALPVVGLVVTKVWAAFGG